MFAITDVIAADRRAKAKRVTPASPHMTARAFPLRREDVRRIVAELLG